LKYHGSYQRGYCNAEGSQNERACDRCKPNFDVTFVRRQRSLDRPGGLNKGEFLAHRNVHRSEDETANPSIEGTS
jgi:hypothetical protein